MLSISVTDLRNSLKSILSQVKEGTIVQITQQGKVIATLNPAVDQADEIAFQDRLAAYRSGGIVVHDDIVDAPLKEYDQVDDSFYKTNIAEEPDE